MKKSNSLLPKLQSPRTYLVIFLLNLVLPFILHAGLTQGISWLSILSGCILLFTWLLLLILK